MVPTVEELKDMSDDKLAELALLIDGTENHPGALLRADVHEQLVKRRLDLDKAFLRGVAIPRSESFPYPSYVHYETFGLRNWERAEEDEELRQTVNQKKSVILQFWSVPGGVGNLPVLQHQMVLLGEATWMNNDIMAKKANVVALTGRRLAEARAAAEEMGVSLANWLPEGSEFWGAAPVFSKSGQLICVVVVSGQNHKEFDQPFADMVAEDYQGEVNKNTIVMD